MGPPDRESEGPTGPVIRDKRRLDPQTGQVRPTAATTATPSDAAMPSAAAESRPDPADDDAGHAEAGDTPYEAEAEPDHPDTAVAAERLEDLRRLQAEYVNYKRRVDRDRVRDREVAVGSVVEALLPVLDDIFLAREHGDLVDGPFAAIADKLHSTLGRFGVESFGAPGEVFDPTLHEALMHLPDAELPEGSDATTIVQVMQPGFKVGDRVVRAARVAVADPA